MGERKWEMADLGILSVCLDLKLKYVILLFGEVMLG